MPKNSDLVQINIRLFVNDVDDAKEIAEKNIDNHHRILREATKIGMKIIKRKHIAR